jgi:hypothetical protein
MIDQKRQHEEKSEINPVVAAVTGAVIGVGVAVAGAVALTDEKNRKRVKDVLSNVKNQAMGYMDDMQEKAADKKIEVKRKLAEGEKELKKAANTEKATHTN